MTASPCGFLDGCCCLLFGLRAPPRKVERGQVATASSSHAPPLQACFSLFHARTCYKHILCHIKVFSLEQVLWCQRGGRNEHPRQKNICWQREKWRVSQATGRLGRTVTVAHGYYSTRHSITLVPDRKRKGSWTDLNSWSLGS